MFKELGKDFSKYKSIFKYDVIVSNPPYFADSNKNNNNNLIKINNNSHEYILLSISYWSITERHGK